MEQMLQNPSERDVDWNSRMGGEEMTESSFVMDEDVEDELDFCMEVDWSLAGQVSVGPDEYLDRKDLDWFLIRERSDSLSDSQEQIEERPGSHRGSQAQDDSKMEADSGSVEKKEREAEREAELDDQSEESDKKRMERAFDVCLRPREESGGHVRITLEEVERYHRFSCCCQWLCGRCQVFHCFLSSFLFLCITSGFFSCPSFTILCSPD